MGGNATFQFWVVIFNSDVSNFQNHNGLVNINFSRLLQSFRDTVNLPVTFILETENISLFKN